MDVIIKKIGKADAIILRVGNQTALIDAGEIDDGPELLEYFDAAGIRTLDALIITHFDKDHVGGAAQILNTLTVKTLYEPDYMGTGSAFEEYTSARGKAKKLVKVTEDTTLSIGDAQIRVNPPKQAFLNQNDNNQSLVAFVTHENMQFLFAGDAEEERLEELRQLGGLKSVFLKVPHHGNFSKNSETFFAEVAPKYAAITCSKKNPPDSETLLALKKLRVETFLTVDGDILLHSEKGEVTVSQ